MSASVTATPTTFAALVAAYQVLCSRLDVLQAHREATEHLPPAFQDDADRLAASLRLVRQARIVRMRLRDFLRDSVAAAVQVGDGKSAIVDRVRGEMHLLVEQHTLEADPALVEEITSWIVEVFPGERSKADYMRTA
jgi:hypothetical protein